MTEITGKTDDKMENFGGIPAKYSGEKDSQIAVVPVPYDGTSTWIKGADKGPGAIIEASANMELYDIETNSEVYRRGIYTDSPITRAGSPEEMVKSVRERVGKHLKNGKFPVIIGGEHSVSIGSIMAFAEHYKNLTVLQLDAHGDLREEYEGSGYNHACVMARAKEVAQIVQAGIRSVDVSEVPSMDPDRVFFAHQINSDNSWIDKLTGKLEDNVYVTIDLDAFDPSVIPSTGTPEPGGMNWYQVMELMKKIIQSRNLVGFDVVELCPTTLNRAPDFIAAKLIYRILSMKYSS